MKRSRGFWDHQQEKTSRKNQKKEAKRTNGSKKYSLRHKTILKKLCKYVEMKTPPSSETTTTNILP